MTEVKRKRANTLQRPKHCRFRFIYLVNGEKLQRVEEFIATSVIDALEQFDNLRTESKEEYEIIRIYKEVNYDRIRLWKRRLIKKKAKEAEGK